MLFEREDWKLFRNMETLPQKAGVPKSKLSLLVCKELTDNALDLGAAYKGKVIPPENILLESLDMSLQNKLGQVIADEILEQNHYQDKVAAEVRQVKENCRDCQTRLAETVPAKLEKEPVKQWRDVVEAVSDKMIKNCRFEN